MKVLFITHYAEMYGANQSMLQLMIELRDDYGVQPIVLLPKHGSLCDKLTDNNIPFKIEHFYWWVFEKNSVFEWLMCVRKQIINYFKVKSIVEHFKNENINFIYTNSIVINIGCYLAKQLKVPHVWHLRESLSSYDFKLVFGKYLSKKILNNNADVFIVISEYLKGFYKQYLPINKLEKIYNGVDILEFNNGRNNLDILNFCMLGVVSDQKNNFDAIKAAAILKQKSVTNFTLNIVGSAKGEYQQLLNEFVEKEGISDFVKFWGHQSNISEILSQMHVGLMCSRDEAFGRVSIEYMLHKMPVIASNSGANAELVINDVSGYLYEIYDAEALASRMEDFINNRNKILQLGETAYEYAKQNFSSKQNTAKIFKLFSNLVHNKK